LGKPCGGRGSSDYENRLYIISLCHLGKLALPVQYRSADFKFSTGGKK
jgi:hypothetical protein